MPSARDVLVERAARDVEETLEELKRRLRAGPGGLTRALELGVLGLVGLLDPRGRIQRDVDKLLDVARRHREGADAAALARHHIHDTLGVRELNLVLRVKEPAFAQLLSLSERVFRERLPDLARMAAVDEPAGYPDLVRRAFPDRAEVEGIVDENVRDVLAMLAHVERNPRILRVPASWLPKLVGLAREMIAWKLDEVRREVDDIYVARDAPATER